MKNWFAIYTKPRWEKKVHASLQQKGMESYCPMNRVMRQWSDRKKRVELPLFPSYVFVKITADEQTELRMTPGVVNFVYWLGKPAVISDKEMESFQNFVAGHEDIKVEALQYREGDSLDIDSGVFKGQKAIITRVNKHRLELVLETLQAKLVVTYPGSAASTTK